MKFASHFKYVKRGGKEYRYNGRPTKNAEGFSKTKASQTKKDDRDQTRLCLFPSLDTLWTSLGIYKYVTMEHPTAKGFFKEGLVLSDVGKLRLKQARRRKEDRPKPPEPPTMFILYWTVPYEGGYVLAICSTKEKCIEVARNKRLTKGVKDSQWEELLTTGKLDLGYDRLDLGPVKVDEYDEISI